MKKSETIDPFGIAIKEYWEGERNEVIIVHSDVAEDEIFKPGYLFRLFEKMPVLEQTALKQCCGKILDVGAAAGCHSLWLQEHGFNVISIDTSEYAVEVMKKRGVNNPVHSDFFEMKNQKFDTILMLMNGAGICGTVKRLKDMFQQANRLLNPGGQILMDSSNIFYMFEEEDGSLKLDLSKDYYGEVNYCLEYCGVKGPNFKWLFVDFYRLSKNAAKTGLSCELIKEGEYFDYLARVRS